MIRHRRRPGQGHNPWTSLRTWPLWSIPHPALAFLLGSEVVAVIATVVLLANGDASQTTLVRVGALAALSIGYSEVAARSTRMQRYLGVDKVASNPMSVWSFAAVLTVPAGWAATFILIQHGHGILQRRRDRVGQPYRVIFSASSAVLAQLAAAAVIGLGSRRSGLLASVTALGGMLVFTTLSFAVLLTGIWLAARPPNVRLLLPDRDTVTYELATLVLGLAAAQFVLHAPLLTPITLVLVAFVHRSSVVTALRHTARTDSKTGLLTSAAWTETARAALSRAARKGDSIAVLMLDLDHFKYVNDAHGHLTGDRVLTAVADCLRRELRGHDGIGRFGGEEFVVVLDGVDVVTASTIAERLRAAVRAVQIDGETVHVTASIGLVHQHIGPAAATSEQYVKRLLEQADAALYQAKKAGRDQVCASSLPIKSLA